MRRLAVPLDRREDSTCAAFSSIVSLYRIAGHIQPRRDFLGCRPPVKRSAGKSHFSAVCPGVVGGIPALSLEIRIIRWKFKKSAGK
jgi:hypothetical protein